MNYERSFGAAFLARVHGRHCAVSSVFHRRLAFIMVGADVVAVSPTSVDRVLKNAGRLGRWNNNPSRKGTCIVHPVKPHEHWHVDVSYINVCGTIYYLCSLLDGCSRYIVHWEIRESMKEADIELVIQRACPSDLRRAGPQARRGPSASQGGAGRYEGTDPCKAYACIVYVGCGQWQSAGGVYVRRVTLLSQSG